MFLNKCYKHLNKKCNLCSPIHMTCDTEKYINELCYMPFAFAQNCFNKVFLIYVVNDQNLQLIYSLMIPLFLINQNVVKIRLFLQWSAIWLFLFLITKIVYVRTHFCGCFVHCTFYLMHNQTFLLVLIWCIFDSCLILWIFFRNCRFFFASETLIGKVILVLHRVL